MEEVSGEADRLWMVVVVGGFLGARRPRESVACPFLNRQYARESAVVEQLHPLLADSSQQYGQSQKSGADLSGLLAGQTTLEVQIDLWGVSRNVFEGPRGH